MTYREKHSLKIKFYPYLLPPIKNIRPKVLKPKKIDIENLIRQYYQRKIKDGEKFDVEEIVKRNLVIADNYSWSGVRWGYGFGDKIKEKESYLYSWKELFKGDGYVVRVRKGDVIGYAGTSAIFSGDLPYEEGNTSENIKPFESWDEVHLHFEEAVRNQKMLVKEFQRDPFDIYKSAKWYEPENIKRSLFIS